MKKESLVSKIERYVSENKQFTLKELYDEFGDSYKNHSIRARVYDIEKKKATIIKIGRGRFALVGAEIEATIECVDSTKEIFQIAKSNIFYDLVFLDIPYSAGGQKGGNRNLASYNLISPEQFGEMIIEIEKVLKDENSQVFFMIAGGRSSIKQSEKYIRMFDQTSLQLNAKGSYTKLTKDGNICNMGKYLMPPELILSYSHDGKIRNCTDEEFNLDFSLQRPKLPRSGGYPTEKPIDLLKNIIKQATYPGERILDLFAGSGVTIEAALELGRKINAYEISMEAIMNHIMPRMQRFSTI